MSFPWIHESEMQAARAEARLEAEGAFQEGRQAYEEFRQRLEVDPGWQRFWADKDSGEPEAGS